MGDILSVVLGILFGFFAGWVWFKLYPKIVGKDEPGAVDNQKKKQ